MHFRTVQCSVLLCSAIQFSILSYSAGSFICFSKQCNDGKFPAGNCSALLIALDFTAQPSTALVTNSHQLHGRHSQLSEHRAVQWCTVQYAVATVKCIVYCAMYNASYTMGCSAQCTMHYLERSVQHSSVSLLGTGPCRLRSCSLYSEVQCSKVSRVQCSVQNTVHCTIQCTGKCAEYTAVQRTLYIVQYSVQESAQSTVKFTEPSTLYNTVYRKVCQWHLQSQRRDSRVRHMVFRSTSIQTTSLQEYIIMHPAQPSEARLGRLHSIFPHIQICTSLLQSELFKVPMYAAHISSSGRQVSANLGNARIQTGFFLHWLP